MYKALFEDKKVVCCGMRFLLIELISEYWTKETKNHFAKTSFPHPELYRFCFIACVLHFTYKLTQ